MLSDFHIVCFTETHLDSNVENVDLTWSNYHDPIRNDKNSFGDGVMIYLSSFLSYKRRLDLENILYKTIWIDYFSQITPLSYALYIEQKAAPFNSGIC